MLEPIRTYFFERAKRKKLIAADQRSASFRIDNKNHFGILVDAGNYKDRHDVLAFAERLRKDGHRVKILGYLAGRIEGASMPFDIFTTAQLTKVSQVPKSPEVDAFIAQKFDALINMSIHQNHKPLDYISSLSRASFRIGPWYHNTKHNPYDLSIDAGASATLDEWINELMHTLQKIY
jgi:hypothetical protein